jgi:hypothetical protein
MRRLFPAPPTLDILPGGNMSPGVEAGEGVMVDKRYGLRQERSGLWTVIDEMTGLPAASDGRDLTGLDAEDARDIAEALNRHLSTRGRNILV